MNQIAHRRGRVGLVLVLVATLLMAACSSSENKKLSASSAFCRAAERYSTELQHAERVGEANASRQLPLIEELARTAPKKIKAEAEIFAQAVRDVKKDPTVKDRPKVQKAVDAVNRYANQACNVYKRDSGL